MREVSGSVRKLLKIFTATPVSSAAIMVPSRISTISPKNTSERPTAKTTFEIVRETPNYTIVHYIMKPSGFACKESEAK